LDRYNALPQSVLLRQKKLTLATIQTLPSPSGKVFYRLMEAMLT